MIVLFILGVTGPKIESFRGQNGEEKSTKNNSATHWKILKLCKK